MADSEKSDSASQVKAGDNHNVLTEIYIRTLRALPFVSIFVCLYLVFASKTHISSPHPALRFSSDEYTLLSDHCADASPISSDEFQARALALAKILHAQGATAYVAEPGPNALYFTNISSSDWSLSERPLLLIVSPEVTTENEISPTITVLTPAFEATRARLLPYAASNVSFVEWAEDRNPYEIAMAAVKSTSETHLQGSTVFVDESIRHFIVDGLQAAVGRDSLVKSASPEITALREQKSPAEIALLQCANEVTLLALRIVREKLYIGIRESETRALILQALGVAGLQGGGSLVLFGENAALPHGGGTDRALGPNDFVLIDTGGTLHGYSSDVTRTFALPESHIPTSHLEIWYAVQAAQAAAIQSVEGGVTVTADVDAVAREVLTVLGYGKYFTHRLGHGIGLQVHEAPYLRGGTSDIIQPGNAFSDEPGVYIEGKLGVRLEDCFYVNDDGEAIYLTEGVGGAATSPWGV